MGELHTRMVFEKHGGQLKEFRRSPRKNEGNLTAGSRRSWEGDRSKTPTQDFGSDQIVGADFGMSSVWDTLSFKQE